jgi:superfamily I DNA/RNA helicase
MSRSAYLREALLKELNHNGVAALDYRADGVSDGHAVLVSTLHNVKGHEFRAVFILGLYEGVLPLYSAVEAEDIEREAALLYVAITRAKELLYLSTANCDLNGKPVKQSRFISALAKDCDILDFSSTDAGASH